MQDIINWFNSNQGFVGAIVSIAAMVVSIVFGVKSARKSKKAKASEEKAKAHAENADKYYIAAKDYYERLASSMDETIRIDLIYENRTINIRKEAVQIANLSAKTITLTEFGAYLNDHRIDIAKLDIKIEELPLSIAPDSSVKITKIIARQPHIHDEDIYYLLGFCLLGKENPYINDGDNPRVFFYVKDTQGNEYKNFIGMRKDLIERYEKE